jgi:hypothetical protein
MFYTCGHLHMESTVRYMTKIEPELVLTTDSVSPTIFPICNILDDMPMKSVDKGI